MTWQEALEIVVARSNHEPYRKFCADDHEYHQIWRDRMIRMASGMPEPAPPPRPRKDPGKTVGCGSCGGVSYSDRSMT